MSVVHKYAEDMRLILSLLCGGSRPHADDVQEDVGDDEYDNDRGRLVGEPGAEDGGEPDVHESEDLGELGDGGDVELELDKGVRPGISRTATRIAFGVSRTRLLKSGGGMRPTVDGDIGIGGKGWFGLWMGSGVRLDDTSIPNSDTPIQFKRRGKQ
ncbi:hypothetical protein K469DRAFT_681748 [Zopfia rhizophila CBS 207.26]|uniref:Uncharacterized protein n=1 Tax=Zopfia rhizophila CBS 207.26 TaxID=1314779 RepID=A0A6A6EWU8_9PEZI|nr:hypothetical protein K469DRAFT_681748 [Zopfia rhizophila CBS 207.26]